MSYDEIEAFITTHFRKDADIDKPGTWCIGAGGDVLFECFCGDVIRLRHGNEDAVLQHLDEEHLVLHALTGGKLDKA